MVIRVLIGFALVVSCWCLCESDSYAQTPGWQWKERSTSTRSTSRSTTSMGAVRHVWTDAGRVTARIDPKQHTATITLAKGAKIAPWRVKVNVAASDTVEINYATSRVFIAVHRQIASGATVYAFDSKTGRRLWKRSLRALGLVSHSQYLSEVRLIVRNRKLIVFGRESNGRYIETIDTTTGRLLHHRLVTSARLPWTWRGKSGTRRWYQRPVKLSARRGGTFVFTNIKNRSETVTRLNRSGRAMWKTTLPGSGFCGNASMVEHKRVLYIVHFCSISTGATVHAVGVHKGALKWRVALVGIGPVGHSKYFNDAQITIRKGAVVVYGNEAFGRYVEARDLVTGRLVSNRSFQ